MSKTINFPCSGCNSEVVSDAIQCDLCQLWTQRVCAKLKKYDINRLSHNDYYYYCPVCKTIFPYTEVNDDEIQFICSDIDANADIFYYSESCNDLNINSFNVNECRTGDWENTVDPDTNFFNDIKFNCEYYTDAKFRAEMKCISGLKIIHFNARSLKSNFEQIKMYLTTLYYRFI